MYTSTEPNKLVLSGQGPQELVNWTPGTVLVI